MLLKEDQHETDLPEWQHVFGTQANVDRGVMSSQAGNLHRADRGEQEERLKILRGEES